MFCFFKQIGWHAGGNLITTNEVQEMNTILRQLTVDIKSKSREDELGQGF